MIKCSFCSAEITAEDKKCPVCYEPTGVGIGGTEAAELLMDKGDFAGAGRIYSRLCLEDENNIASLTGLLRARTRDFAEYEGEAIADAVRLLRLALLRSDRETEQLLADREVVSSACAFYLKHYDRLRARREGASVAELIDTLKKYGL